MTLGALRSLTTRDREHRRDPAVMLLHGIASTIAEFSSRNLANEVTESAIQKAAHRCAVATYTGAAATFLPSDPEVTARCWCGGLSRRM